MSELSGFTVFETELRHRIHLSVRKRSIGISVDACNVIGSDWVNVFFDERKRRCMIKRAEPGYRNVLKISDNGDSGHVINSVGVSDVLRKMFGDGAKVPGHEAGEGIVIFEEGM